MADEQNQGGFPQNQPRGQDPNSTTGDGHPPRPGEKGTEEGVAGQGLGQGGGSSQGGGQGSGGSGKDTV
ncbi:MAG TPA: hypothetical protein VF658_17440 [Pyrinomonadaceae bacterium]|jgi:hypothetical protein